MKRIVLDTNVIVSGTLSTTGPPARILDDWQKGRFSLVTSNAITDEVKRILNDPQLRQSYPKLKKAHVGCVINLLNRYAVHVPGSLNLDVVKDDPDDNKFVEAAVEGQVRFIVSGDKHLVNLKRFQGIRIITPAEFLAL